MIWTRKFFDQWEWFHKPISPMEESLLISGYINGTLGLITKRLGIMFPENNSWRVIDSYLYFSGDYWKLYLQPSVLVFPFKFIPYFSTVKKHWVEKIIPNYQSRINEILDINIKTTKTDKLLSILREISSLEANLLAESIFVILFAVPAELFLKLMYRLFVKDRNSLNYNELLVGYPDLGIQSDSELWEVAQEKSKVIKERKLNIWIAKWGYRIQDKDILYQTLGENREMIDSLLKLYINTPNPKDRVENAKRRREQREIYAVNNLRFSFLTKGLFGKVKNLAQEYAQIRNSRPYYYMGNRIIRQILLELSKRTNISNPNKVFYLTMDELNKGLLKNIDLDQIASQREKEYQKRLNTPPRFTIQK